MASSSAVRGKGKRGSAHPLPGMKALQWLLTQWLLLTCIGSKVSKPL